MPPKGKPPTKSSSKQDLVPVGKREVFAKNPTEKQKERVQKPTTSRALVLRNGKYGSQGTGELMLMSKLIGREKLDLLAESLVKENSRAVSTPFRLEKCLKIAESQSDAYVADILKLRDPKLFYHAIEAELRARADPARDGPRKNASHVAKAVGDRIHNSFLLASGWHIVSQILNELAVEGLTDNNVKMKLKGDPDMRNQYLVVCDMVKDLIILTRERFGVFATTTPHYAKYFKLKPSQGTNPSESKYVFDWSDLRRAGSSFLDSIIIEMCFPDSKYPISVLFQILHDAEAEAPRETKRFPQEMWDAVGDLSDTVELGDILSAPLFGEGEEWKEQTRKMPEEYQQWIDAQILSVQASDMVANYKDTIFPLEKTKRKDVLDNMWKKIDDNYVTVSGLPIDDLWNLGHAFNYAPQWSAFQRMPDIDEDSDEEAALRPGFKPMKKEMLAITNQSDSDSMPELQSVSNSDDDDDDDDDSDEPGGDGRSDDESGYNTEEEDEIREKLREAMDAAHEADWFEDSANIPPEIDPFLQDDRKGNPFLSLLGSLRGRMFSANPKLKTTTRTEPRVPPVRGAFRATPSGAPKVVPKTMPPRPTPSPVLPVATPAPATAPGPKSRKATVEEVEDEDEVPAVGSKKKKKKGKKKKKPAAPDMPPGSPSPSVESVPTPSMHSPLSSTPQPITSQESPSSNSTFSRVTPSYMSSTTSLPISDSTAAQSGRSYLQSLNLKSEKKVKSRPDHASLFSNPDNKKQSFLSKLSIGKDKEKETKDAKRSWFSKLSKKTTDYMHQLLKTNQGQTGTRTSMKWEHFLKLMREMGFSYDPSTAGSSVRFDPPDKNDRPITFHKPHPDPTLQPHHLDAFAKRLKDCYGWNEDDLLRA